jgi:hypothetical protein
MGLGGVLVYPKKLRHKTYDIRHLGRKHLRALALREIDKSDEFL